MLWYKTLHIIFMIMMQIIILFGKLVLGLLAVIIQILMILEPIIHQLQDKQPLHLLVFLINLLFNYIADLMHLKY